MKNYLLVLLLYKKIEKKEEIEGTLQKLIPNAADIRDIFVEKYANDHLASFKARYPVDFFQICVDSVMQLLVSDDQDSKVLFEFVNKVTEQDDKKGSTLSRDLSIVFEKELS